MTAQSAPEATLAKLLVEALNLQDVVPGDIVPTAPLFGFDQGSLGLDSIDALEIALAVQRHYGVELRSDDEDTRSALASLRALNEHVLKHQAHSPA
jgi:acyl carrier protein